MTLKDFVNEVMNYAEQFLRKGDHENYSKCIQLIADAMYEAYEENENTTDMIER